MDSRVLDADAEVVKQVAVTWLVTEAYEPEKRLVIGRELIGLHDTARYDRLYRQALDLAGFRPDSSGPPRRT